MSILNLFGAFRFRMSLIYMKKQQETSKVEFKTCMFNAEFFPNSTFYLVFHKYR